MTRREVLWEREVFFVITDDFFWSLNPVYTPRGYMGNQNGTFQLYWKVNKIQFWRDGMTLLDVVFKYGTPPGEKEMGALNNAWEVYGVRKIKFDEKERTIRVEYDASRLNDGEIAGILRRAGIDLREKVQLV
jgi:hypothetical protein